MLQADLPVSDMLSNITIASLARKIMAASTAVTKEVADDAR